MSGEVDSLSGEAISAENVPIERHGPARLPLRFGSAETFFTLELFVTSTSRWVAAYIGDITNGDPVLTRVESACTFGHIFMSSQCDCRDQLHEAFAEVVARKRGLILFAVDHDARGLGLASHFDIYRYRQIEGYDTEQIFAMLDSPLDARDHTEPAQILKLLGVEDVELLTNNAARVASLVESGIQAVRLSHEATMTRFNATTLFLEKEDLGYDWAFEAHTGFINAVTAKPSAAWSVRHEDAVVAESMSSSVWDLSWPSGRGDASAWGILYSTHIPPLDQLDGIARSGVQLIVVATPAIDLLTSRACEVLGMRITDWARPSTKHVRESQSVPVSVSENGDVLYSAEDGFVLRDAAHGHVVVHRASLILVGGVQAPATHDGLTWYPASVVANDPVMCEGLVRVDLGA